MKKGNTLNFYAAANGYGGFRSYFGEIFAPEKYSAIFILKGGPGTGKSSLMKKIAAYFSDKADSVETIYCSSDPASLDGVIIKRADKSVAIIDGTAPHATDPIYPGAIESIVNLGEFWNTDALLSARGDIEKINEKKSEAYRLAYNHLKICGEITASAERLIGDIYVDDEEKIDELSSRATKNEKSEVRLITSYGKHGFGKLDTLEKISDTVYTVVGVYGSEYLFMKNLRAALEARRADAIYCPSALDGNKTDGIYLKEARVAIVTSHGEPCVGENVVDTSKFLNQNMLKNYRGRLEFLWKEREAFLWSAADEFKKASDEHFKLEDIYVSAMCFEEIDKKAEALKQKTAATLDLD